MAELRNAGSSRSPVFPEKDYLQMMEPYGDRTQDQIIYRGMAQKNKV